MTRRLGRPVRLLGAVGSTMTEATAWAAEGAPHGALVVAETQRAGRGRHGRTWADDGQSLLLTLVLRPRLPAERRGLVSLAAGLAVAEAADAFGVRADVKWPNDVRVGGRKLAGILAEAAGDAVLLGIGLNVGQTTFPADLAAASLTLVTGRPLDRLAPLDAVLDRLTVRLADAEERPAGLLAAVEARLEGLGAWATVRDPTSGRVVAEGTVAGIRPDGGLRLATEAGEQVVHAGEVTLSPVAP